MKPVEFESGLLPTFRLFVIFQLGLLFIRHYRPLPVLLLIGGDLILLLLYLFWNRGQQLLRGFYLPLGIGWLAALSLVEQFLFLNSGVSLDSIQGSESYWLTLVLLVFPLLVLSWQYKFIHVVIFTLGTALVDYALTSRVVGSGRLFQTHFWEVLMVRMWVFLVIGYLIVSLMRAQRLQRASLVQANRELAHYAATLEQLAVSQERNRLARELHDTLAHTLSGLSVQLEACRALWEGDPVQAHAQLMGALTGARQGLTETRQAIQALRATPLEDLGFLLAMRSVAQAGAERAGWELLVELPAELPKLPPDVEQAFFRAAQEILENCIRHAGARRVEFGLRREVGRLVLTVHDDGQGFDPAAVSAEERGHFGLQGLAERAALLGGRLEINCRPGGGTEVVFQAPVFGAEEEDYPTGPQSAQRR